MTTPWLLALVIVCVTIIAVTFITYLRLMLHFADSERKAYLLMAERITEQCMIMVKPHLIHSSQHLSEERKEQVREPSTSPPPLFTTEVP